MHLYIKNYEEDSHCVSSFQRAGGGESPVMIRVMKITSEFHPEIEVGDGANFTLRS